MPEFSIIKSQFLSNEKNENELNLIKNKSNNHIFIIKKKVNPEIKVQKLN